MNPKLQMAKQAFEQKGMLVAAELDMYHIPDEKIKAVIGYYAGIMAANRDMKVGRIVRKTVEYFKLKKRFDETTEANES